MPDSSDGEPPGNVVWLGNAMSGWIAKELQDWWAELLDLDTPEHLTRIVNQRLPQNTDGFGKIRPSS